MSIQSILTNCLPRVSLLLSFVCWLLVVFRDVASKKWVVTKGEYTVWGLQASQGGTTNATAKFNVA